MGKELKENGCVYRYNWIALLYSRIYHYLVNQLYVHETLKIKNFFKCKGILHCILTSLQEKHYYLFYQDLYGISDFPQTHDWNHIFLHLSPALFLLPLNRSNKEAVHPRAVAQHKQRPTVPRHCHHPAADRSFVHCSIIFPAPWEGSTNICQGD